MSEANQTLESEDQAAQPVAEAVPPRSLPWVLKPLTYLVLLPLISVATGIFGSISLLCGLWDKEGRQQHAIARMWARTLLRLAFSPVVLEGAENLQGHGAAVYASNHLSYYDTPVLFGKLPFQFRILAKAPLWKIPFIGWYLSRSGQVPIDNSSVRAGVASLGKGVTTLKSGMPLMIFPEGGRAATGRMKPLAAGAAWMAIKAQVPVIPLTIVGTYELLPMHAIVLWPRRLRLIVGQPISTVGMSTKDADALTEHLRNVMQQTYDAHHK